VRDAEVVEHARDDEVDEVVDARRASVEAGHRRQDRRAGAGELQHVLEVDRGERRLARDQHERPPLLERDVGRALDQVVGEPVRDRAERSHRARAYGHRVGGRGSGGDRRHPVVAAVDRELPRLRSVALGEPALGLPRLRREDQVALLFRDDLRGRRIDEADRRSRREQAFEQPQAVGHARGAGQGERDGARGGHRSMLADTGRPQAPCRRAATARGPGRDAPVQASSRWRRSTW